jgi:hypothetical protein
MVRKKRNATAILALDLLLGWTVLGWVAALVWALTRDPPLPPALQSARAASMLQLRSILLPDRSSAILAAESLSPIEG